jgi:DNA-binding XRE family transcriptional regulator
MKKSWDRAAMRFTSARYAFREGMLDVTFANGDRFVVAAETVLPISRRAAPVPSPDWSKLRIGETDDVLEVPAKGTVIEIPWDRIRSVADADFRAHLADVAAKRARCIGGRIREMRLQRGLTRVALADKVGVPREMLANLEAGKMAPPADLLEHLALALGRRLRDFAEE